MKKVYIPLSCTVKLSIHSNVWTRSNNSIGNLLPAIRLLDLIFNFDVFKITTRLKNDKTFKIVLNNKIKVIFKILQIKVVIPKIKTNNITKPRTVLGKS